MKSNMLIPFFRLDRPLPSGWFLCILLLLHEVKRHAAQELLNIWHPNCGLKRTVSSVCEGKRFLIAYPGLPSSQLKQTYSVFASTDVNRPVQVEITRPEQGDVVRNQTTVKRGYVSTLSISDDLEITDPKFYTQKSVQVHSTEDITLFVSSQRGLMRYTYWAVPYDGLGKKYYAITFAPLDPNLSEKATITIIAAKQGRSSVSITFPDRSNSLALVLIAEFQLAQYSYGDSITKDLNQYEVMHVQAVQGDLTGTLIESDKEIVVLTGNDQASLGIRVGQIGRSNDRGSMLEQMIPVDTWGLEFVTLIPKPLGSTSTNKFYINFRLKVVASWRDTRVQADGDSYTLKYAGSSVEIDVKQPSTGKFIYIKANRPVLVAQLIHAHTDVFRDEAHSRAKRWTLPNPRPSMILLPAVDQWYSRYTFDCPRDSYRPTWTQTYMLVFMIDKWFENGLLMNGNRLKSNSRAVWYDVTGTKYTVGYLDDISVGYHVLSHSDRLAKFGAWFFGAQSISRASFGYPLGILLQKKECSQCYMTACDFIDNDCDYAVDEELCNDKDDDGDGKIDEDCCGLLPPAGEVPNNVISVVSWIGVLALIGVVVAAVVLIFLPANQRT